MTDTADVLDVPDTGGQAAGGPSADTGGPDDAPADADPQSRKLLRELMLRALL